MTNSIRLPLFALAALATAATAAPATAKSIRIYTQKVDAAEICGSMFAKYRCSTTKKHMKLSKADIPLNGRTPSVQVFDVLGKTYDDFGGIAADLPLCGGGENYPFTATDIVTTEPTTFDYEKKLDKTVSASVQADVKNALIAAGVTGAALEKLTAEFAASYKKAVGREYAMTGTYYRTQLSGHVINQIRNPSTANANAKRCGDYLRSAGHPLIYSIAVIKLDTASFVENAASDAMAEFKAKVASTVPSANIASLEASLKVAIKKSLSVGLGEEHRVISWDYLVLS